jgi:hypothetical protein
VSEGTHKILCNKDRREQQGEKFPVVQSVISLSRKKYLYCLHTSIWTIETKPFTDVPCTLIKNLIQIKLTKTYKKRQLPLSRLCISSAFFHRRYTLCAFNAGMAPHLIRKQKQKNTLQQKDKRECEKDISKPYLYGSKINNISLRELYEHGFRMYWTETLLNVRHRLPMRGLAVTIKHTAWYTKRNSSVIFHSEQHTAYNKKKTVTEQRYNWNIKGETIQSL